MTDSERTREYYDRRRFLQVAGIAGAVGLAGCAESSQQESGGGGTGSTDTASAGTDTTSAGADATSAEGVADQALTFKLFQPPDKASNWNMFAHQADIAHHYFLDPLMWYNRDTREWIPAILEDFSVDGTVVDLTVNDEAAWENGDPVTASDLTTQWKLRYYVDQQNWPGEWESVEAVDDSTVRVTTTQPTNQQLFAERNLTTFLWVKESEYGEWLTRFEEAGSDSVRAEIRNELTGANDTEAFTIEDPVANGPFSFDSIGSQALTGTRNPNYAYADNITFDEIRGKFFGNPQTLWQSFITDSEMDAATNMAMPGDVVKTLPDHIIEFQYPQYAGLALIFQHRNELLRRPRVKRALAWAVNRQQAVKNGRPRLARTVEYPDNVKANRDYWLGDRQSQMIKYGYDSADRERAASLLREAGFSKQGGSWQTPSGETWSMNLIASTKSADSLMGQTITQQLNSFGIDMNFRTVDPGTWWSDSYTGAGFEDLILAWSWAGFENPYWGYFYGIASSHEHMGHGYPNPPDDESGGEPYYDGEWMVDTPWPAFDPDGTQEVNVRDLIVSLQTTQDEQAYKETIQQLAWIYNRTLPKVPLEVMQGQHIVNPHEWDIVSKDDPAWLVGRGSPSPQFYLPRSGQWTAKQ
jgi:peptide/nickel transport system substrate-binding protein